jgi:uncharacterized glyoxalase superfamily protein PhnB
MPQFRRVIPVLKVNDLQHSIDYYTQTLGFSVCWRAPNDGGGENCWLDLGETSLMLSTGSHLGGTPSFTGTLYIDMDGVEEFYEEVKDRVELVWPLDVMDYGTREFGVRDPNGYILAFSEAIERG